MFVGSAIELGNDDGVDLFKALGKLFVGGQEGFAVATPRGGGWGVVYDDYGGNG